MIILEKLESVINQLSQKKAELDLYRPLPKELVDNLNQWFKVQLTYSSNALEGNTLTHSETALVIEKGITIAGKTLNEHLEAIGHAEAFDYILELAHKKKEDLTLSDILNIHSLILSKIDKANAGIYRKVQVKISGTDLKLPEPIKLLDLMEEFINWLYQAKDHPVLIAAKVHLDLVTIHPFIDGNGRTARLLMNLLLIQQGYPPAVISPNKRSEYIQLLADAQTCNRPEPFFKFVADAVLDSLNMYLEHVKVTVA